MINTGSEKGNMIAQVKAPGDPSVGIMASYATVTFTDGDLIFEDVPEAREHFREGLRKVFAELYDDGGVSVRFADEIEGVHNLLRNRVHERLAVDGSETFDELKGG